MKLTIIIDDLHLISLFKRIFNPLLFDGNNLNIKLKTNTKTHICARCSRHYYTLEPETNSHKPHLCFECQTLQKPSPEPLNPSLIECIRCHKWFEPQDPSQTICKSCQEKVPKPKKNRSRIAKQIEEIFNSPEEEDPLLPKKKPKKKTKKKKTKKSPSKKSESPMEESKPKEKPIIKMYDVSHIKQKIENGEI